MYRNNNANKLAAAVVCSKSDFAMCVDEWKTTCNSHSGVDQANRVLGQLQVQLF